MKNKHALLAVLIATGAIWACNKEDIDNDPATPPAQVEGVFSRLFENNITDATQSYTVNNWGSQVIAQQGTRLNFAFGAFVHEDGTPATGQVNVEVVEVLSIGDMIWLNKQTVGNDNGTLRMLRSGGAIMIKATQGGENLGVVENGVMVEIPTLVGDPSMAMFSGSEASDGRMIWNPVDTATVTVVPDYVDVYYNFYIPYYLNPDSLNWMNCDYFATYPSTTNITAEIPDGQNTDSTQVWIGFPTENAVMNMYNSGGQNYATWQVVPVGMQAVVIGLRQGPDNSYFSSFNYVTISEDINVPMTFSPTTLAQFEAAVNTL